MEIKRHNPGPRMSAAVVHGDTIYLAGQVADDGKADTAGQTQQVLGKIDKLLAAVGSSKSKLLAATIFITDMRNFQAMNTVWDAWVEKGNPPTRATVEARLARTDLLVEIVVIAAT